MSFNYIIIIITCIYNKGYNNYTHYYTTQAILHVFIKSVHIHD